MAESFSKVTDLIKTIYLKQLDTINTLISIKRFKEVMDDNSNSSNLKNETNNNQTENKNNLSTDDGSEIDKTKQNAS